MSRYWQFWPTSDRPQSIQKTDSPPQSPKYLDLQAASLRWRGHHKAALTNTNKGFARESRKYMIEKQEYKLARLW